MIFSITSARLEDRRIVEVARLARFEFEKNLPTNVKGSASFLEFELLKLGVSPKFSGLMGHSEFRALPDTELEAEIDMIKRN